MRQEKCGNPTISAPLRSVPKRNRVPRAEDPGIKGCESIQVMKMKGSDLFKAGKKSGKETGDSAKEAFAKGKATGQKEKETGKEAGNGVSVQNPVKS